MGTSWTTVDSTSCCMQLLTFSVVLVSQVLRTSPREWTSYTSVRTRHQITTAMRQYGCAHAAHRLAATYVDATCGNNAVALCCTSFRSDTPPTRRDCMSSRQQQQNRPHRSSHRIRLFRTVRSCWPEYSLRSSGKADKLKPHGLKHPCCKSRTRIPQPTSCSVCCADTT